MNLITTQELAETAALCSWAPPTRRPIFVLLRTFLCSMKPERTSRCFWIFSVIPQAERSSGLTASMPDRIVSVIQPFVRPIVREKAGKPMESGAKLDISAVDGWTRLECCSFDAYNEAGNLQEMAERFREREGHYPSRIQTDRIYRNRENLNYSRHMESGYPGRRWGAPRRAKPEIRLRITGMSASVWKWSAGSVWQSVNVALGWSPHNCGKPLTM